MELPFLDTTSSTNAKLLKLVHPGLEATELLFVRVIDYLYLMK